MPREFPVPSPGWLEHGEPSLVAKGVASKVPSGVTRGLVPAPIVAVSQYLPFEAAFYYVSTLLWRLFDISLI